MFQTIFRRSAAFSIPLLVGRVLSILLLPIYTRYLSVSDYGVLELLELTLFVYANLFSLQQSSGVFYYLSKDPKDAPRVLSTAFVGTAMIGVLAGGAGMLAAPYISRLVFQSAQYALALQLYFISMAFGLLAEAGQTQLRAGDNMVGWNMAQMMRIVVQAVVAILLLVCFQKGYYSILWGSLAASAAVGLWIPWRFYRRNPLTFDGRLFLAMFRYSLPLSVGAVAMLFIHYGDRFFLQRFVTLREIGIYALAYKIGMLSYMVHTPFVTYWSLEMYKVNNEADGKRLYVQIFTYLVLALSIAGALIVIFNRPIIALLTAPAYHDAVRYIPWITLAYVIRSIGDHLRTVFFTEKRTGMSTQVTILGAATCLAGYSILIPRFNLWGRRRGHGRGFHGDVRVRLCAGTTGAALPVRVRPAGEDRARRPVREPAAHVPAMAKFLEPVRYRCIVRPPDSGHFIPDWIS